MQIVRELADEGNPTAKIAFLTRLTEDMVREILAQPAVAMRSDRAMMARASIMRPCGRRQTVMPKLCE